MLAKQLIETGQNDCVLAVGFEKMERGSLTANVIISHWMLFEHSFEKSQLLFSEYRSHILHG